MKEQIPCPLAASTPVGELENKQSTGKTKKQKKPTSNVRKWYVAQGEKKRIRERVWEALRVGGKIFKMMSQEDLTEKVTFEQRW